MGAIATGEKLGPYLVEERLGAGGMGEVWRASDPRLGRDVAIKVLYADMSRDPERLRRFEIEARAAGALSHPNVLAVLDVGTHDGAPYLVTELLEGKTVRERIVEGPVPPARAVAIAVELCRGLSAAHDKGIIHRDLKPENLFLLRDGRVKILDFGIAKLGHAGDAPLAETMPVSSTKTGVVVGTAAYMAPEQLRAKDVDARTDLWSVGVILHELITGKPPFTGDSTIDVATAVLQAELPPLDPDVPPQLASAIHRCLARDPDERFQSARDLAYHLEGLHTATVTSARLPALARARSNRWPLYAGLALAAVGIAAFVVSRRDRAAAPAPKVTAAAPSLAVIEPLSFRRGFISGARFANDGRSVLYSAAFAGEPIRIYQGTTKTAEVREVSPPRAALLALSDADEVAMSLEWQISRPFTAVGTLATASLAGGAPRAMIERVVAVDYAPDGTMALVRLVGHAVHVEWPSGTVLVESNEPIYDVRVSPDGKRLALTYNYRIEVVDRTGAREVALKDATDVAGIAWGPSGDEVWTSASRSDDLMSTLYAVAPGREPRVILPLDGIFVLHDVDAAGRVLISAQDRFAGLGGQAPGGVDRDLSWNDGASLNGFSDDGQLILFGPWGFEDAAYVRPTDGGPVAKLGVGTACGMAGDGRRVAILPPATPSTIDVLPTGVGETTHVPVGALTVACPIVFVGDALVFPAYEAGRKTRLWRVVPGEAPRAITPEGVSVWEFLRPVSPDGTTVVAADPDDIYRLYPMDGGAPVEVKGLTPDQAPVGWTTDGARLYVQRRDGNATVVTLLDPHTGKQTAWKRIADPDPTAVIHEPYVLVTPDGRGYAYHSHRVYSKLFLVSGVR